VELPFLRDGFQNAEERLEAIAEAVELYLAAKAGKQIPGHEDAGDEMPEPLYWLLQTERWGLPHGGGYLDEPYYFMRDIEWAALGRDRYEAAQAVNRRQEQGES